MANSAISTSGGSSQSTITIAQVAHGFAVGDIVRLSGTNTYTKAQANSAANAEMAGMVSSVLSADAFTLSVDGQVTGLTGLTAAEVYFLSPTTAGAITATAPTTSGQIKKPVFYAQTTTTGIIYNLLGIVVSSSATTSGTVTQFNFTNANGFTGTVSTATTTPTLTLQRTFDSTVRLQAGNGYGSTNTKIRRFTTTITNTGSDITYADSATNGATFTINTSGVYCITYYDTSSVGAITCGLTLNSAQLTTSIRSVTASTVLNSSTSGGAAFLLTCTTTNILSAGDVVRAHAGDTGADTTSGVFSGITITRVG